MRSSSEEAVSQLNKWKSESASVLVSTTGRLTFALVGRISHVSSTEVHIEIPGAIPGIFRFLFLCVGLHLSTTIDASCRKFGFGSHNGTKENLSPCSQSSLKTVGVSASFFPNYEAATYKVIPQKSLISIPQVLHFYVQRVLHRSLSMANY